MVERWRPVTGKVYRIGDRLLRLLYVRRGEPTFEIEIHPLPIEWREKSPPEELRASVRSTDASGTYDSPET